MVNLRRMKKFPSTTAELASDTDPADESNKENNKTTINARNFGKDISNKIPEKATLPTKSFVSQAGKRTLREPTKEPEIIDLARSTSSFQKPRPKLRLKHNPLKELPPWDRERVSDPLQVSVYAGPITSNMLLLEDDSCYKFDPAYLIRHPDLSMKARKLMVNMFTQSQYFHKMNQEVLFMAVSVFDRYLSHPNVKNFRRENLQLLGLACMLISSKYEEIYPPSVQKLIFHSEEAISLEDLLDMEGDILQKLDFKLTMPSSNWFFNRFAEVCELTETMKNLGSCLVELLLFEYEALQFKRSQIAAAAVLLCLKISKVTEAEQRVKERLGWEQRELRYCSNLMMFWLGKMNNSSMKLTWVKSKYGGILGLESSRK